MTINERPGLPRRAVLALAAGAMAAGGAARAANPADLVSLTVVDRETGEPLRIFHHRGRSFVAGRPGARYGLRIANRTGSRVLVVMSVDGVNILTGQTAGYGQRGYVFDPWQSYEIAGWRKTDREVAAFTFAALRDSYAARTGRPHDVGVIGIAAFTERVAPPSAVAAPMAESARPRSGSDSEVSELAIGRSRAAPPPAAAPSGSVQRRSERLGTGHGAREWSRVTQVAFERATPYPQLIRRIEYDTYANLVAAGVIRPRYGGERRPRPFPSGGAEPGYVPDPPGGR